MMFNGGAAIKGTLGACHHNNHSEVLKQ